jgi:TolA-binding protein
VPALGASPSAGEVRRAGAADRRVPPPFTSSEPTTQPRNETEARMLARALAQLRQQHDPRAAIATLDRLAQTYPGGVLAPEALATRIEAALAMNDLATATKLVETAAPPPGRAGAALLVVRAELRARAGRCDAATRDFALVLDGTSASAGAGDLHERALYGRGVCLGHLGQAAGARRDLAAYLREHPNGRFSAEARRLLAETPGAP